MDRDRSEGLTCRLPSPPVLGTSSAHPHASPLSEGLRGGSWSPGAPGAQGSDFEQAAAGLSLDQSLRHCCSLSAASYRDRR